MNCIVEETGTFGRKLRVDIPATDFNDRINSKLRKLSATAKIKGFRPGKAPIDVIKRYYGEEIKNQTVYDLLNESYKAAITEHSFNPLILPSFEDIKIDEDKGISYTAYIEIMPDLELNTLTNVTVEKPISEIVESDVDTMVERVRKNHAEWQPRNGAAQVGDRLKADITTNDGEKPSDQTVEGRNFILGSNVLGPNCDEQLENVRIDEVKHIEIPYPDDYGDSKLAGKIVQYRVHIKSIEEPILPELDEGFFKKCNIEEGGIDALRNLLREGMEQELKKKLHRVFYRNLENAMLKHNDIETPPGMLKDRINEIKKNLFQNTADKEQTKPSLPDELFKEAGSRQVRLRILFSQLCNKHDIKADRPSCELKINEVVQSYAEPEKMKSHFLGNADAYETIQSMVMEDKIIAYLTENADIVEKKYSFYELIDLEQST